MNQWHSFFLYTCIIPTTFQRFNVTWYSSEAWHKWFRMPLHSCNRYEHSLIQICTCIPKQVHAQNIRFRTVLLSFHIWNLIWFRAVRVQNQNERFSTRKDLNWANFTKKDWFKSYATLCAPQCSIVGHLEIMYVRVGHAWITLRSCASRISLSWELHTRTVWGWD